MVRIDRGKFVIAAATTDIKEGEEVTDSYGSTFSEEEWEDRRAKLRKDFWFSCLCFACKKKWPCRDDLPCNMFEAEFSSLDLGFPIAPWCVYFSEKNHRFFLEN